MRALVIVLLGLLLCLAGPAAPALATGPATVAVEGQAELSLPPDVARLTVGVISQAATAEQAAQANARDMGRVLAALKAKLGARDTLQSAGYWLRPRTRWNKEEERNEVIGYQATHQVTLTSRDPKATGEFLDTAVKAGANSVNGPYWELADPAAAQRRALAAAYADAKAKAAALAAAAGSVLGPVLKIKTGREQGPAPLAAMRVASKGAANTTLEPGLVKLSAEVRCVFALAPKP